MLDTFRYVAPFGWKVVDWGSKAADVTHKVLIFAGRGATDLAGTLGSIGRIGGAIRQGKELYDFAEGAFADEGLYWDWRYYKSLYPERDPFEADLRQAHEFAQIEGGKVRALRDLGKGAVMFFGNPLLNKLFPLKWRGPPNDPQFQQWVRTHYVGHRESADPPIPRAGV